ncbi:MAG TPA: hypothetical protein VIU82_25800, partial [Bosea sp. (in: a-proteobacteria)]
TASIMETSKDQGKRPRNPRMQRLTWRNLSDDRAAAPCRESGLVQWRDPATGFAASRTNWIAPSSTASQRAQRLGSRTQTGVAGLPFQAGPGWAWVSLVWPSEFTGKMAVD